MKYKEYIKDVHNTLLGLGIDAKLSFGDYYAQIETIFGNAVIYCEEDESLKTANFNSIMDFGVAAMRIISKACEYRHNHIKELTEEIASKIQ